MPHRVQWEPAFSVGREVIDLQHQGLLHQCNLLADHCAVNAGGESGRAFDEALDQIKRLVQEHFESEAALLANCGYPELEEHRAEFDEFDFLAGEVATTENFDRIELQRFLVLWCVGHITSSARQHSAFLAQGSAPA